MMPCVTRAQLAKAVHSHIRVDDVDKQLGIVLYARSGDTHNMRRKSEA